MNVLLVGNGGREHAIAKKIAESKLIENFYSIPGNPGINTIAKVAGCENNNENIVKWAKENKIDLIVCGPEAPLVDGLSDIADQYGIPVFGPKKKGAMLEGSKIFAKNFMKKYNIPTAKYETFNDYKEACNFIEKWENYPVVIKASGLAAGKGVKIPKSKEEALQVLKDFMIDKTMGESGKEVVIEEFMEGEEMSIFYLTDGKKFLQMIAAKDYKRVFDNDMGENTGGMGCYAPHQRLTKELSEEIENKIIPGIKKGFEIEQFDYRGVLYIGLMLTKDGPKVVEFNCRFGDPETQGIMPLLDQDVLEIFYQCATGNLQIEKLKWKNMFAASVVIAMKGYPGVYKKGVKIDFETDFKEFIHSGTTYNEKGEIVTNGGRVLNAVCLGNTKEEALKNAYELAKKVHFDGAFYRSDIGK